MRGMQKSKRVSWASDFNLCQVRLFLSEESPSQVGLGAQDHLQAKASGQPHPTGVAGDDILPPGFEGGYPDNSSKIKVSDIRVIKWRCPPRFVLDLTWQVVSGEESKEVEAENQREMRVLEAVYPRPSAIPQNPTFPAASEDPEIKNHYPVAIPIIPIEDEDAADNTPVEINGTISFPMKPQPNLLFTTEGIPPQSSSHGMPNTSVDEKPTTEVIAAATAAFAAINKSNENGSLIDPDLLIKILSNPKLIEKLVTDHAAASMARNIPNPTASFGPSSDLPPPHETSPDSFNLQMNRMEARPPSSLTATSSGSYHSQPNVVVQGVPHAHPNVIGQGVPHCQPKAIGQGVPHSQPSVVGQAVPHVQPNVAEGVPHGQPNVVGHGVFPSVPVAPPGLPSSSTPTFGASKGRDMNYLKNLVQQHGGERQEHPQQYGSRYGHPLGTNLESVNPKPRDQKPKIMKPCIYFNSSRGCRHGANCAYQHDTSVQQRGNSGIPDMQSAKRMKMDREISS